MSWLDIALLVALIIPVFTGFTQGLIKAVLSLAGLVVGVLLAGRFHGALAGQLTFISSPAIANIVAFAIIAIGVMLIASIIAAVLKGIASAIMLGWLNRLGGAVFGLVLGAVFCGAGLAIWVQFFGMSDPIGQSLLAKFMLDIFPMVLALLPAEFSEVRGFFR
ncbi:MAG: CvpA family protein [Dehalococcoidales bacterium]|nr:CvpA family protein [Dehalococcoidales bacterium]